MRSGPALHLEKEEWLQPGCATESIRALRFATVAMKECYDYYDKKHMAIAFQPGDKVLLHSPILSERSFGQYAGPFTSNAELDDCI